MKDEFPPSFTCPSCDAGLDEVIFEAAWFDAEGRAAQAWISDLRRMHDVGLLTAAELQERLQANSRPPCARKGLTPEDKA